MRQEESMAEIAKPNNQQFELISMNDLLKIKPIIEDKESKIIEYPNTDREAN